MKGRSPAFSQVPLDIVGSNKFGRYPKISTEQTYNMIISDGFLVPYAGYQLVTSIIDNPQGRGIYTSNRYNHMIAVVANRVYTISTNLTANIVGSINTFEGEVYIDENNNNQIAICDQRNIYIYNYITGSFQVAPTSFIPGYITYQNGRFISPGIGTSQWFLSEVGNGLVWSGSTTFSATLQTKPDIVVATQRFPGRGNLLYVFGKTVVEMWQDVGSQLFPYQRNATQNVDYGCLSASTIAFNENIIVWLASNEKSGPMIAYSTGGDIKKISTDGIDFKFSQLTNPSNSYGFLFRQDGHLLYQITFPDDNLTYCYDFNTDAFFTLCDKEMNAHIAKRIAFFNDDYYFVSSTDGNLYQLGTQFITNNGEEIPRIRVCKNIRMPDASRFSVNNLTFTIEQGVQENVYETPTLLGAQPYIVPMAVDLSISKDGGYSFGSYWRKELNARGLRKNRLIYWNLGAANDLVPQFRFWGLGRFVATDGITSLYQ